MGRGPAHSRREGLPGFYVNSRKKKALSIMSSAKKAKSYKAESPSEEFLLKEVDRVFDQATNSLVEDIQHILKDI